MRKYFNILAFLLCALLIASPCLAFTDASVHESGDSNMSQLLLKAESKDTTNILGARSNGGTLIFKVPNSTAGIERVYGFELGSFRLASGSPINSAGDAFAPQYSTIAMATTAPMYINFPDGTGYSDPADAGYIAPTRADEKIVQSFIVPRDYRAGGQFEFWITMDATAPDGPDQAVLAEMFVLPLGTATSSVVGYTLFASVSLADQVASQRVEFATSGLATGSAVSIRFWRVEDINNATRSVRVMGSQFSYSASY